MDRYNLAAGAAAPPGAPAAPANPYYTAGTPGSVPATAPGPWFFHMVTEELRKVITDAGLTPDHANLTQLSQAIQLFTNRVAVIGSARNLVARNNAGTPNTKVDYAADEVVVKSGAGVALLMSAWSGTVDCATVGADGVDAGALGNNQWWYLWAIGDGTNKKGLLSQSSTAPTMPGGYTYKALLGVARTNGSAQIISYNQFGRDIEMTEQVVFTGQTGQTSYGSQSLSAFVPPIAKGASGHFGTTSTTHNMAIAGNAAGLGVQRGNVGVGNAMDTFALGIPYRNVPLITAQTIYWKTDDTGSLYRLTSNGFSI